MRCVFSSEWDKYAQITYKSNFGEIPAGDITKIESNDIPDHDILCGGFPCQAFSISGKQKGFQDTRGTLFFEIARIVEKKKPKVLFLENVKNLVKHDNGQTLKTILRVLKELNYDVFYKVVNSSHFGMATSRERVFFVAFRKDLGIKSFVFPASTQDKIFLKDILEPEVDDSYFINRNDIIINKIKVKPKPGPIRIGTINSGGQGERIYSIEGHAITLSAYGGGAASKTGAYLIGDRVRKLTPRECARVMGFPESFIIPVDKNQAYKQFGNSVPVKVVSIIFESILSTKTSIS